MSVGTGYENSLNFAALFESADSAQTASNNSSNDAVLKKFGIAVNFFNFANGLDKLPKSIGFFGSGIFNTAAVGVAIYDFMAAVKNDKPLDAYAAVADLFSSTASILAMAPLPQAKVAGAVAAAIALGLKALSRDDTQNKLEHFLVEFEDVVFPQIDKAIGLYNKSIDVEEFASLIKDRIVDLYNDGLNNIEDAVFPVIDRCVDVYNGALDKYSDALQGFEDFLFPKIDQFIDWIEDLQSEPCCPEDFIFPEIEAFAPNLVDEFRQGRSGAHTIQRYDPLSLDLDGDGLETTAAHTAGVLFDHDGDGIAHGSGWIAADDGLLVLDRNGNGRIDTGAELFGDHTDTRAGRALNGFAPLIELDDNGDGRVDAQDARFSALRVWRDLNQNGVSESNELFSLASLGIRALNIAHSAGNTVLANGNVIAETGTFTRTDGSSGTLADVNLLGDATRSRFSDNIPATETAGALPCIRHAQSRQRNPCRSRPTPWRAPRTARNSCFRRAYIWRARTWRSTAIPWRSRRA